MTFHYESGPTKITYETEAVTLEGGYDYGGGILDHFADFLRGCSFPLERDETITVYDPEKEVILEKDELESMRDDLLELEVLREEKAEAETDDITDCDVKTEDGWIAWNGGPCPVSRDTRVEVKFADGNTQPALAVRWIWTHSGELDDIVAYRVLEEA